MSNMPFRTSPASGWLGPFFLAFSGELIPRLVNGWLLEYEAPCDGVRRVEDASSLGGLDIIISSDLRHLTKSEPNI